MNTRPHFALMLGALGLLVALGRADAQETGGPALCYKFDHSYFRWNEERFLGDSALLPLAVRDSFAFGSGIGMVYKILRDSTVVPWRVVSAESSAVVVLSDRPHASDRPGGMLMAPPAMPHTETTRTERELSNWRSLKGDSLEVGWRNGHSGVTFRMAVDGDTLRGRARFTVDIFGREPRFADAQAVRVACPQ